jgi:hypothetical protein
MRRPIFLRSTLRGLQYGKGLEGPGRRLAVGKLIRVKGLKQLRAVGGIQTIGLDLGDRYSQFCAVGGDGEILQEGRLPTAAAGIRRFLEGWDRWW